MVTMSEPYRPRSRIESQVGPCELSASRMSPDSSACPLSCAKPSRASSPAPGAGESAGRVSPANSWQGRRGSPRQSQRCRISATVDRPETLPRASAPGATAGALAHVGCWSACDHQFPGLLSLTLLYLRGEPPPRDDEDGDATIRANAGGKDTHGPR